MLSLFFSGLGWGVKLHCEKCFASGFHMQIALTIPWNNLLLSPRETGHCKNISPTKTDPKQKIAVLGTHLVPRTRPVVTGQRDAAFSDRSWCAVFPDVLCTTN